VKVRLAEQVIARVLAWDEEEAAAERPLLQAMAEYKYDEYQQFSPGMRFLESLALWLAQFATPDERRCAYDFIKRRLVYCSSAEMTHFVETAYLDLVRPVLLRRTAVDLGESPYRVARVAASPDFRVQQRQCLILGLSDGARIDAFRRANRQLDQEQIWQTYELSSTRVKEMLEKLAKHVGKMTGSDAAGCKFRTIVLLDDFSASGSSYYMPKANGRVGGKIANFCNSLLDPGDPLSELVDRGRFEVIVLLYVATEQARRHLSEYSERLWGGSGVPWDLKIVQTIPDDDKLAPDCDDPFRRLVDADAYYDHGVWDEHLEKGGTADAKYGYAACGLPLVLHHNSPNNSLCLLWSYDDRRIRGLFPRVRRHKEMS
jgi:hypothetical protein